MTDISKIPTDELRKAAYAWRLADEKTASFLWWGQKMPSISLHDRIDDMLNEIERLRNA